jgi:hypothetical protein
VWRVSKRVHNQAVKLSEVWPSDELDFPSFADGNVGIMYGHCLFSSDEVSILADMSVRLMPKAAQREEGLNNSGGRGSDATSRRKKRARDTSQHTEILLRHGIA